MEFLKRLKLYFDETIRGAVLMLAGVGIIHIGQLLHWWNFTVDSMEIHPAQAEVIQKSLEYGVESADETVVVKPPKRRK